ncbi:M23 family metallopeptidase [Ascidiimonas sp. W6]|uniref:M23 family metallopeptidase n=1 Tax=Ascidiimonas meishanensis TaxID=3128903 RepID=UPI0030EE0601
MLRSFKITILYLFLMGFVTVSGQKDSTGIDQYSSDLPNYFPLHRDNFKRLSSNYGYRIHPIDGEIKKHRGIDLVAKKGSGVYASASGKVVERKYEAGYGNYLVVRHNGEIRTLYGHLLRAVVKEGDCIVKGQVIGYVGDSGRVTGPHLHYEIWVDEERINPFIFWNNTIFKKNEVSSTSK